uniref:Uncharacterized protein n=1 Tax=Brassica oleracea var. oleracea TaxID=109376 RepID=A0A0D3D8Z4_BRAOL
MISEEIPTGVEPDLLPHFSLPLRRSSLPLRRFLPSLSKISGESALILLNFSHCIMYELYPTLLGRVQGSSGLEDPLQPSTSGNLTAAEDLARVGLVVDLTDFGEEAVVHVEDEPDSPSPHSSYHTSPAPAPTSPAPAPLAPAAAPAHAPPGPPGVMSVAELVRQPGRDHLPYLTPCPHGRDQTWFNRSRNRINAWINRMMYSVLDKEHPTFTDFPTDKQHLWFRQFAQEFNWNFDDTLFIYHHFVHNVMDKYGKQIREWKKKWEINKGSVPRQFPMKIPRNISSELPRIRPSENPSKYPEEVLPRYIPRTFPTNWWSSEFSRKFISSKFRRKFPRDFRGKMNFRRVISEDLFRLYVVGITLFRRHTDDFFPRYVAVFL